jgi:dephospho-CoA kinase
MQVGLTGNIGSGKTTIAKVFKVLGWVVFNSDDVAKSAYYDENIKKKVINLLGKEAYQNNQLNKVFVSQCIFNNKSLLENLNGIIHPYVKEQFKLFAQKHAQQPILKESALLYETGIYKDLHKTILVTANDTERLKRIQQRDRISEELALKKMNNQMAQSEKIKLADFVIENNANSEVLAVILAVHSELASATD